MAKPLKVLFATYEVAPFVKLGGLGDVAGSLPKALKKLGVDIRVIAPKYLIIKPANKIKPVNCKSGLKVYSSKLPNSTVPIYFIKHKHFDGQKVFGYNNGLT